MKENTTGTSESITTLDLGGVNAYLWKGERQFVLFDCGGFLFADKVPNDRRAVLEGRLTECGCVPGTLGLVVLTHGDIDHVANAHWLQKTWGAQVLLSQGDADLVHDLSVEKILGNFRLRTWPLRLAARLARQHFEKLARGMVARYQDFVPDGPLEPAVLRTRGIPARVLALPGHTPGSVGILFDDGSFIVGDSLANEGRPGLPPNARDFPLLVTSLENLADLPIGRVYPGHGAPFLWGEFVPSLGLPTRQVTALEERS